MGGTKIEFSEVKEKLSNIEGVEAAVAFGSFARDECHARSKKEEIIFSFFDDGEEKTVVFKGSGGSDIDIIVFADGDYIVDQKIFEALGKFDTIYDISVYSTGETTGILTNLFKSGFYEHIINNNKVFFDRSGIMKNIKGKEELWNKVEEKTGIKSEYISDLSYKLLKARRRCYRLHQFLPKYGIIEPLEEDIFSFKSAVSGFMRDSLKIAGVKLGKDDYKETVVSRFLRAFPDFDNGKTDPDFYFYKTEFATPEGKLRRMSSPPYVSSHFMNSVFEGLYSMSPEQILNNVNEGRKLVEHQARTVNKKIEERMHA